MQLTKESILIDAQPGFAFMLHYDWEKGVIWLSKNSAKSKKVRLTTKDVYISEGEKDKFHRYRTGYGPAVELGLLKPCSYITKENNENIFNYWVKFMYDRYMNLKHRQEAIDKGVYNG